MKHRLVLSVVIASCLLALRPALAREWTDSSGTHKIEAELVKLDGEIVHLKKADGAIVKVPLNKLCEDDRKFVREPTAPAPGKANDEKPSAPVPPPVTVIKIRPGQVVAPPDALVKSAEGAAAQRDKARIKFLTEKLGLDADQQAKITAIYEADDLKLKELMNTRKYSPQALREMLKARNDAVNAVLTPEQQEKFKGLGSGATAIRAPRAEPKSAPARPAEAAKEPPVLPRFTNAVVLGGVKVSVTAVGQWAGGSQGGTYVQLKIGSSELVNAKGIRAFLKEAKDDAGNVLPELNRMSSRFVALRPPQPGFQTGLQSGELRESFSLIATGKPKAIKQLTGTVEVLLPTKDPGSVITASFAKDAGVPLQNAALKAAGVEITLLKPSDAPTHSGAINGVPVQYWKLAYMIKDPQGMVFAGECLDAPDGKVIGQRPQWLFENMCRIHCGEPQPLDRATLRSSFAASCLGRVSNHEAMDVLGSTGRPRSVTDTLLGREPRS